MKYRDNMTQAEIDAFMAEINALDNVLSDAAKHYADQHISQPEDYEDESEYWRRAGLDSKGRP